MSAIEGPEDGAGEIAEDLKARIRAACCGSGEAGDPANYCAPFDVIFPLIDSALATRAPSESAPSDEDIKRAGEALYRYGQATGFSCPPSWTPHWRDWYRELARIVVAALKPEDQITREARDE